MPFPTRLPTVPHLKEDGSNWAAFAARFEAIMWVTHCWAHFDGTATRPAPRDVANLTSTEKAAMREWAREDATARQLLSGKLPDRVLLATRRHKTANALWDALTKEFGHSDDANAYTPEGVALAEPDSTPGEDATHAADIEGEGCSLAEEGDTHAQIVSAEAVLSWQHTQVRDPKVRAHHDRAEPDMQSRQPGDTNARAHLEGAAPEPSMDEEEHHSLEVEEEGTAGENASIERDMGPRVELQHPGVSPPCHARGHRTPHVAITIITTHNPGGC